MEVYIDTRIFPLVMSTYIEGKGDSDDQSISLPRGANLLYLQGINDPVEIKLLKKYADNEALLDVEYEELFGLFVTTTPRLTSATSDITKFYEQFGVSIEEKDGKCQFVLIDEYVPQIRVDTWEHIAISLLKPKYTDIINCFDFDNINLYLGSWKSQSNAQLQSLLDAFRKALLYTIIGYLYGDDRSLYSSFNEYFDNGYYKRISLIHGIWKHRKADEPISYLPIYDSFYNLKGATPSVLVQTIQAILNDNDIIKDERDMIRNRLVEGAEEIHRDNSAQQIALEQSIIKPVVNFIFELQKADENLNVATELNQKSQYDISISRSYYAMMHSLKALLEKQQQLSDWEPNALNVKESHRALEEKLENLSNIGIIARTFFVDFKYVKQKRWVADYNVSNFDKVECEECIRRANAFLTEVKSLTS